MEILRIIWNVLKRLFGFGLIGTILWLSLSTTKETDFKLFLFINTGALILCWLSYNKFIGTLEFDLAVMLRLVSSNFPGLLQYFVNAVHSVNGYRLPMPMTELPQHELVEWHDAETNPRVRRMLSRGLMTVLLGQYDGRPRYMDLADIGKVYISAPDRSGKTNNIIQMVASILLGHPLAKKEIDFVFIDITRDLAQLRPLGTYVHDMKEARKILMQLGEEVDRRNILREKHNYAGWWHEIPLAERPKPVILIVDEAIQVLQEGGDVLRTAWSKLINIGHKNGIMMITTSLYQRGDLIPTEFVALMRGKIVGYMGTQQAYVNVLGSDYYQENKADLTGYVDQKYHFALCVRPKKPLMYRTVFVPKDRLEALVQESVIDPSDYREVILSIWWRYRGKISAEDIGVQARAFVEAHPAGVRAESVHKKSVLETLRYAVMAGIASKNGERDHYLPSSTTTSFGILLERWDSAVSSGLMDKRCPSGQEMLDESEYVKTNTITVNP
jgi:hypothetical protein